MQSPIPVWGNTAGATYEYAYNTVLYRTIRYSIKYGPYSMKNSVMRIPGAAPRSDSPGAVSSGTDSGSADSPACVFAVIGSPEVTSGLNLFFITTRVSGISAFSVFSVFRIPDSGFRFNTRKCRWANTAGMPYEYAYSYDHTRTIRYSVFRIYPH